MTAERASAVQIESPAPRLPSEPPEFFDVSKETRFTVSAAQVVKGAGLVAAIVLAIAAALPNLLPKTYTIATQSYVEESVEAAKADGLEVVEQNTKAIETNTKAIGAIKATVDIVVDGQHQQMASHEAERVTKRIKNSTRRVRAYDRVKKRALKNLKSSPPRDPLEGVDLDF